MTRWAGLGALLGCGALASGACYPDYQFSADDTASGGSGSSTGGTPTTGGNGAVGGIPTTTGGGHMGGGGAGGVPTTTVGGMSGGGGMPAIPEVNCDAGSVFCDPGDVCCFDDTAPYTDVCANPGGCPASYYVMQCDDHDDCSGSNVCCGTYTIDGFGAVTFTSTSCKATCNGASERPTCVFAADCSPANCDEYYPGYSFCNIP